MLVLVGVLLALQIVYILLRDTPSYVRSRDGSVSGLRVAAIVACICAVVCGLLGVVGAGLRKCACKK